MRVTTGRIVLQREQLDIRAIVRMACDAQRDAAKLGNVQLVFAAPDEPLVAPEMLQLLFEMFVQADSSLARSQGGLCIGLTLARKLAELHGGTLTATSPGIGRGSEFSLRLPLRGTEIPGSVERTEDGRALVLLIEDDEDLRTALEFLLRDAGFVTDSAGDGAEGLELALQVKPAVAIIDIGLPKIDGYELCKRLRAELGDTIRLVAMTGYGTAEDRRRALERLLASLVASA